MFLSIPGICIRRKTGSPYGTSLPPYANSNRTELVRKLLLEFERLVQRFLKFLLRLAISGPIAFLHGRVGILHCLGSVVKRALQTVAHRAGATTGIAGTAVIARVCSR